jgi:hypothetical protein
VKPRGDIDGDQARQVAALNATSQWLQQAADLGHLILVLDEDAEGAVARRLEDLLVAQHALLRPLLGYGGHDVAQRQVPSEEGNVV